MLDWLKASGIRALRSFAGALLALMGANAVDITGLDWLQMASIASFSAIASLLMALKGLPEIPAERNLPEHRLD